MAPPIGLAVIEAGTAGTLFLDPGDTKTFDLTLQDNTAGSTGAVTSAEMAKALKSPELIALVDEIAQAARFAGLDVPEPQPAPAPAPTPGAEAARMLFDAKRPQSRSRRAGPGEMRRVTDDRAAAR